MSWRAFHVYFHGDQDRLVVDGVAPIVADHRGAGVNRWFFLRYWKGGPHVRVRLSVEGGAADGVLESVRSGLLEYVGAHPSTARRDSDGMARSLSLMARMEGERRREEIVPDNTVRLHEYRPEHEKYGGSPGVEVAERLFERSSDIAVDALEGIRRGDASRLALGFVMVVAGSRGAGFDGADLAMYLERYSSLWSRYVSPGLLERWSDGLAAYRDELAPFAAAVLRGEGGRDSGLPEGVGSWASATRSAMEAIDERSGDILHRVTMPGTEADPSERREFLLSNYLHTHNNRLGISPVREAYLAYLAHHVVCDLVGCTPGDPLADVREAPLR